MNRVRKIANPLSDVLKRTLMRKAVAVAVVIAAAMLILPACQHRPAMAHSTFVHLPADGWQRTLPLSFTPEFDDPDADYRLTLAIRHGNDYPYRNLALVVDCIAEDSTVDRHAVNLTRADEFGNWQGGGFGTLYQATAVISESLNPAKAHKIVVWPSMQDCDTLHGVTEVGIKLSPNK